jgi:hypothetical protein
MRKPALILLVLLFLIACIPVVQADQIVPFAPPENVTGNYVYHQGNDLLQVNTNFPISSQDIVYPDWLFGMMLGFIVITIYFGLVFMSRDPAPWVNIIACGVLIFGLGLSAAMMAPLVGYSQVFHQVIVTTDECGATVINSTNTVYFNHVIVYTMGVWISYACYGIAIGGGFIFVVAGFLLQMKEARRIANEVQQEKIMGGEIDFRQKERRGRS